MVLDTEGKTKNSELNGNKNSLNLMFFNFYFSFSSCPVLSQVACYDLIISSISFLDIQIIFILLAENVKFILGFLLYSFRLHVSSFSSDNYEYSLLEV
jgi:hypothetical protein